MKYPAIVIMMGVAGCGKSTVGRALAERLAWLFYDGDDFHSAANVAKMAQGIPLTDRDRAPWLAQLHQQLVYHQAAGQSVVLACSALKRAYRQQLRGNLNPLFLVHLRGDFKLIQARLQQRQGHFMTADLLQSQFADLEEPPDPNPQPGQATIVVEIDQPLEVIIKTIVSRLPNCAIAP